MPGGDGRIEHTRHREVIKTADWLIDFGPEGGDRGGEVVAEGTPEQVAKEGRSYTDGSLGPLLEGHERGRVPTEEKKGAARSR